MNDEEIAYRTGFQQGAEKLLLFIEDHLPIGIKEIAQGYVRLKLMNWRNSEISVPPPPVV